MDASGAPLVLLAAGGTGGITGIFLPHEQPNVVALVGPVLLSLDGGERRYGLVH